ncbi:MAG: DUF2157 domain-containing protein [Nitrospiraceae bacterium]
MAQEPIQDRTAAQARVDRIHAFQAELTQLQQEGHLTLSADAQRELATHHTELLHTLEHTFDVDTTTEQKQMSLGMRIVSLLGALAFAAGIFLFFYRIWGLITTPIQLLLLISAPILALFIMEWTRKHKRQPYFTAIAGLVAFAAFVLNLQLVGRLFNITPSPKALLPWAALAFLLAYLHNLRLLLVAGILCSVAYLSVIVGTWRGLYWLSAGDRPENLFPAGLLLCLVPVAIRHHSHADFPAYYRFSGLLTILLAILVLSHDGHSSYLLLPSHSIEVGYQLIGFLAAGLTIWLGIRQGWPSITNLGSTFFAIDLFTKFYDWWWDWMPKYLFFLSLGCIAILLLFVFQKLRTHSSARATA